MLSRDQIKMSLSGLELEARRDKTAQENNLGAFISLYKKNLASIPNLNKKIFWNDLLTKNESLIIKSPIFVDKIKIVSEFLLRKKGKIIDIGFGYGYLEDLLRSKESLLTIFGIDVSTEAVNRSKRKFNGITKAGLVTNIPFKDRMFEGAVALDVLEHVSPSQLFRSLKEISRILKSNGFLVVSVPLNEGLKEMIIKGVNPNGHVRAYTPNILNTELKIAGFNCEGIRFLYAYHNLYEFKSFFARIISKNPNLLIGIYRKTG